LGWQVRNGSANADGPSVAEGVIGDLPDAAVDMPVKKTDTSGIKIG
jgi:hypothetical protein